MYSVVVTDGFTFQIDLKAFRSREAFIILRLQCVIINKLNALPERFGIEQQMCSRKCVRTLYI